jgi:ABC-2 type transport system permease protein
MLRHLKLIWLFARLSVQDDVAYRLDFLAHALLSLFQLLAELIGIWTIFSNTRSLAGWNAVQVLALLGVFRVMVGIIGMLISPNMRTIMEDIRDGKLDYAILRPVNTQFLVSVRRVVLWRLNDILLGLGLVAVSIAMSGGAGLSPARVALFAVMLAAGVTIIYSFWLVLATMAIWFTRINNIEMVFWNVFEAGRYPVTIYRPWVRWGLTYVIPLAFLTTFPASTLLGKTGPGTIGLAVVAAGLSLAAASRFWRWGLRHYSGASA